MSIENKQNTYLHGINAIRVIAEYLVVRYHVLVSHNRKQTKDMGPIGTDIMSFFFVLSGFVVMYASEKNSFSTWKSKTSFIMRRMQQAYPVFLFCWLCCLPVLFVEWHLGIRDCWARKVCTFIQLGMLDVWAGCGFANTVLGVSWYLSCLVWLWIFFPFAKNALDNLFLKDEYIWTKMSIINAAWAFAFYIMWQHDIYTIIGFPPLRLGEFIIGCGASCALKKETPFFLAGHRFWFPFFIIISIYAIQQTDHGMSFMCLHENAHHSDCSLWRAGQEQIPSSSPCITVLEKIGNKYALVWAAVIHGIARTELNNDQFNWITRLMHADIFKFLNGFSLTLYLGHVNTVCAIRWLGTAMFDWNADEWSDDTMLFLVYLSCYFIHCMAVKFSILFISRVVKNQPDSEEDKDIIICN